MAGCRVQGDGKMGNERWEGVLCSAVLCCAVPLACMREGGAKENKAMRDAEACQQRRRVGWSVSACWVEY